MPAKLLMLQGTASSVGKSLLATAFCRILRQDGCRVAPFKAQNMSNNSHVTNGNGEIGRAQAAQAEAAGVEATVAMNPILLKPEADHRSQLVVMGKAGPSVSAREYYARKPELQPVVLGALSLLRDQYDVVVIEGAGSPAEINLRSLDLVNMGLARAVAAPVVIVGDIDRGGVFAHLVGTLELLEPEERALVQATIINKFRGDPSLLDSGLAFLEKRTGVPVLGVVPHLEDHGVPEEDAALLDAGPNAGAQQRPLEIAVIRLPRISNFTDFEPLAREPAVWLRYVATPGALGDPDLVIIPGTKSTIADLQFLVHSGLAQRIKAFSGPVMGVCGGLQMLGERICDPDGVESPVREAAGLSLLPLVTTFTSPKTTVQVRASACAPHGVLGEAAGCAVSGYEIHNGRTTTAARLMPAFQIDEREDGAVSSDGRVFGTYIHGVFDADGFRRAFLAGLARTRGMHSLDLAPALPREAVYDRLAARVRASLDMDRFYRILDTPIELP